jgi:HlyD family type I secretion membrane fusion protein
LGEGFLTVALVPAAAAGLAAIAGTFLAWSRRPGKAATWGLAFGAVALVTTIGGVVKPGQDIAEIVPADKAISIEARLSPKDRAEVWPGLPSIIKISAYDYSIHGGLKGEVVEISPDALTDEQGRPYFRVRLSASASSFGPQKPVVPGMIADIDILTGRHSVMSYLLKPINRISERALRQ